MSEVDYKKIVQDFKFYLSGLCEFNNCAVLFLRLLEDWEKSKKYKAPSKWIPLAERVPTREEVGKFQTVIVLQLYKNKPIYVYLENIGNFGSYHDKSMFLWQAIELPEGN